MPLVTALVTALLTALPHAVGAAEAAADSPAATRRGGPLCAEIRVSAPNLARPPRDLAFSSRDVLDLRLEARLRRAPPGEHVLRFKVLTPAGFLYQIVTVPFTGDVDRDPTGNGNAGTDRPRGYAVGALLPVAGTSITQSSLYGRWTVQPYLDDEAEACGPPARFTIRE